MADAGLPPSAAAPPKYDHDVDCGCSACVRSLILGRLTNVGQMLDGWHQDGTAWTEWDESVKRDVLDLLHRFHDGGLVAASREGGSSPDDRCSVCGGSGESEGGLTRCPGCNGSGRERAAALPPTEEEDARAAMWRAFRDYFVGGRIGTEQVDVAIGVFRASVREGPVPPTDRTSANVVTAALEAMRDIVHRSELFGSPLPSVKQIAQEFLARYEGLERYVIYDPATVPKDTASCVRAAAPQQEERTPTEAEMLDWLDTRLPPPTDRSGP